MGSCRSTAAGRLCEPVDASVHCRRLTLRQTLAPVAADEELTWDFGPGAAGGTVCHCGAASCRGFLPFDQSAF